MEINVEQKLAEAEHKAWLALRSRKYMMFGYYAAIWVNWNKASGRRHRNPFRSLVDLACNINRRSHGKDEKVHTA